MTSPSKIKTLADTKNQRDFIKLYFQKKYGTIRGLTVQLAKMANTSSSLMSHIIRGTRQLSLDQAYRIAENVEMIPAEKEHFMNLVLLDLAGDQKLKKYFNLRINDSSAALKKVFNQFSDAKQISDKDKNIYYSDWTYSAVRILSSIPEFQNITKIAKVLNIDQSLIEKVVHFLVELKLCERNGDRIINTPEFIFLDADDPLVKQRQISWRLKAIQSMDHKNKEDLFLTFPMSISQSNAKRVRELILETIAEIKKLVKSDEPQELVCLNIDWTSLTHFRK